MRVQPFGTFLKNTPIGYAYCKIITKDNGKPVDHVFLDVNMMFERFIGIPKSDLLYIKASAIQKNNTIQSLFHPNLYEKIVEQDGYEPFETYNCKDHKWFQVYAFSHQIGYFHIFLFDITANKNKIQQYENIFNINLGLLGIVDHNGHFQKVNQEWKHHLGFDVQDLEGKSFMDFIHPDDLESTKKALETLKRKKDVIIFTNRYLSKTGEYKIIEWQTHPHEMLIYGTVRNITDNQTSEKELTTILETMIDGFCITDLNGNIKKVNSAFCKMFGYEKDAMLKINLFDLENAGEGLKVHKHKIIKQGYERFQSKLQKQDGTYLNVDITVTLYNVNQPKIVIFVRDISKQKQAEEALARREKHFNSLFMDSPVSILIHDKDTGQIINANKKALSLYKVKSLAELDFLEYMLDPPFSYDDAMKWIHKTVYEGPQAFEWLSIKKDGERFWEKVTLKLIQYNGEERIMATNIDITELKVAQKKAEAAGKAKIEFLSNMSHEIRTPLNGIIGFTDLLKNTALNAIQQQFLDSISSNANALLNIVNDILDFSQIEDGKLQLEKTFTDLSLLIKESLDVIRYEATKKQIELILTIEKTVPKYAYVDSKRLKQILLNLLSNAVKFTEKGQIALKCGFSPIRKDIGKFFFSVKDTGIGMKKEQKQKLFKAFSQVDTSTTKRFSGTGLGLILSQRIAQKMNSEILFQSEWKKGSTFFFHLQTNYSKKQNEPSESLFTNHKENNPSPVRLRRTKPKILIVDDEETSRLLFKTYIKAYNQEIKILEATNGKEAVIITKQEKPDLILMDVFMPVLDGISATEKIRKYEKQEKIKPSIIFALTATNSKEQEEICFRKGMDAYLTKPLKKQPFIQKLLEFWDPIFLAPEEAKKQQEMDLMNDNKSNSFLNTLKDLLKRNDLSAIDFLENNKDKLVDIGYTGNIKVLTKKILDLKYKEALLDLDDKIKTSLKKKK